jgi:hypothetical protein
VVAVTRHASPDVVSVVTIFAPAKRSRAAHVAVGSVEWFADFRTIGGKPLSWQAGRRRRGEQLARIPFAIRTKDADTTIAPCDEW